MRARIVGILLVLALLISDAPTTQGAHSAEVFPYASPESQGISTAALKELHRIVLGYVATGQIVGAELLVIKNRTAVLHETAGWIDVEDRIPMMRNTIFNIRSMTKPVTGAAIQLLIDEGSLRLEDRAADYLPGFDGFWSRQITVEQLLTHRSGLPLTTILSIDAYPDLQAFAQAIGQLGPQFAPGTRFQYSDAGAEVLGALVERASGLRLDAFLRERLLEPMRMGDTLTPLLPAGRHWSRIADLYFDLGGGSFFKYWSPEDGPFYPFAWGSQSLYSTPMDYARFLTMWLDGGQFGRRGVLSANAVERTLTPVSRMLISQDMAFPTGFYELNAHYGQLAVLFCRESDPRGASPVVVGHSGSDGTWAWAWPQEDLIVLYFTQSRGNTTGLRLEAEIDRLLIHPEIEMLNAQARAEHAELLDTYLANFAHFHNAAFTVLVQNGRLALDVPGEYIFPLAGPDDRGRWHSTLNKLEVSFVRDASGVVTGMRIYEGATTHVLPKGTPVPEPSVDPVSVRALLGIYRKAGGQQELEVFVHNGRLALKFPGVELPLELYPPDEDSWRMMRLNPTVFVRFNADERGEILSLTMRSPQGEENWQHLSKTP